MNDKSTGTQNGDTVQGGGAGTDAQGRRYHRRRGDIHEIEESSHIWLVSFTDVMALMLTFFVLLFSMTEPAKDDWSAVTAALQAEFKKFYGAPNNRGTQDFVNIDRINFSQALSITYLDALVASLLAETPELDGVTLTLRPDRLIVSMPRDLLFAPGRADVGPEGKKALYALGGALGRIRNAVEVAGNADPRAVPVTEDGYESNWDLSLARAAAVAAILQSVGYGAPVTIRGHSSGRYDDLATIADDAQRLDLARRVDIIVLDHSGAKKKLFFDPAPE